MSRLIIKNLPLYVTPEKLRQHFEQKGHPPGTITDVQVSQKPDGTSRRFGFVGFKSDQEALAAQKWFDRTFIDSTRISVLVSEGARDAPAPRPNKRRRIEASNLEVDLHSSFSKPNVQLQPPTKSKDKLDEFMEVMQPKKGPAWANEVQTAAPVEQPPIQDEEDNPPGELSDLDWMKQRTSKQSNLEDKAFEQSDDDEPSEKPLQAVVVEESAPPDATRETILQTARLFVRNLAYSCTDEELGELFRPYGEIAQVHTPLDALTKQRKGVAYVTFAQPANAVAAYEALDKKSFQGRLIHILGAVDRRGRTEDLDKKKTVKDETVAKRKAAAGKDFNWSMLYMNSDAVASSIASRMNISKSEILNPDDSSASSSNPAVKLSLAETHIIQETKAYLESQGVLLSSFSSRARSDTTILVKNIPYGTTEQQIREMFEPHGMLSRVLVPPAGTMGVVEYDSPADAKQGFKSVAYRRLGNSIIYLEKGPLGMFDDQRPAAGPNSTAAESSQSKLKTGGPVRLPEDAMELDDADATPSDQSIKTGSTLYIKNLSFSTTSERLNKVLSALPSFSFARIQTKPDPNPARPGARLSMGYGFVGFKDTDGAKKALKSMHGFVLGGHALSVSFAGRGADQGKEDGEKGKNTAKSRTTKMLVKNVPFEATRKDIRDLFGSHGHLKSVRLPKRFDSRSRGFAFLEFVSRHEAENAYAALKHTHLLGRHLVLEWAEEAEQDLDLLRKKAGVGFGGGKDMPGQKRKLDFGKTGEEDVEDVEA
ncbi:hypothetical protein CPB83DRAFT_864175 [Crepidotus variabilis]|uniref:RRM domain-containing protein n=1 Tax=Crepidotus variabilis TaxID=179855 RepID=A0A9P6E4X0_9AGAR|nr:hypothetical protein CPB83DRAFT_864175 [Crepidotus variabilis]